MKIIYYFIPILTGLLGGIIQNPRNRTTLRSRLMVLLLSATLIALIPGWRLYSREIIGINALYRLLINAGISAGILILLERLLKKNWWWALIAGALIGLLSVIIARRHVTDIDRLTFGLGILVGGGYLLGGLILKTWRKRE